jgi:tripartite-type tricarboxylate transporter receptor subunit TctC
MAMGYDRTTVDHPFDSVAGETMRARQPAVTIAIIAAIFVTAASPILAQAQQKFPVKPVRLVVGFSPGSATDLTARMVAQKLEQLWGHPVVIDNRSGAGGQLATVAVAKSAPDGYTLLMISSAMVVNAVLPVKPMYDLLKEFTGVAQIGVPTSVVLVDPKLGVKSVKDLIALAQARPGKLLFGTSGAGSGTHMTTEIFNMNAGIKATHVAFKGLPEVMIEVAAGRLNYGLISMGASMPFIQDKRVVPLAVVAVKRSPLLPDVPTVAEILPSFERDATHGIIAPAGTPRDVLNQISKDIARTLEFPDVKERMDAIGFERVPMGPEEYTKLLRRLHATLSKTVVTVGLRAP